MHRANSRSDCLSLRQTIARINNFWGQSEVSPRFCLTPELITLTKVHAACNMHYSISVRKMYKGSTNDSIQTGSILYCDSWNHLVLQSGWLNQRSVCLLCFQWILNYRIKGIRSFNLENVLDRLFQISLVKLMVWCSNSLFVWY